jgi:UDP-glucose 4-epimerase
LGKFISNSTMEIWGNGEVIRDFVDVQDVASALRKLVENNITDRTFNVGSGEGNSLNELLSIIENIMEKNIKVVYKDKRSVDLDRMILNIDRIKNCIDFNPKSLKQGINDFIEFIGVDVNGK